jgi:hypothetical protein
MQAAQPGCILISEDVERQVSNKLDLDIRPLARKKLKNIDRPLDLYLIFGEQEEKKVPRSGKRSNPGSSRDLDMLSNSDSTTSRSKASSSINSASRNRGKKILIKQETAPGIEDSMTLVTKGGTPGKPSVAPRSISDRIEEAAAKLRKGIGGTLWRLTFGALFGWLFLMHPGFWTAAGGLALGVIPGLSGIRKSIGALAELREIRKEGERSKPC